MSKVCISSLESLVKFVEAEPQRLVEFHLYAPHFLKEVATVCSRIHKRINLQTTENILEDEQVFMLLFANYACTQMPAWDSLSTQSSEVNKDQIIQLFFQFNSQCVAAYLCSIRR